MSRVVEGLIKNGEIFLAEDLRNIKRARVKIVFQDEEDRKKKNDFLLKSKLKIRTEKFKFNREELYDRKDLH